MPTSLSWNVIRLEKNVPRPFADASTYERVNFPSWGFLDFEMRSLITSDHFIFCHVMPKAVRQISSSFIDMSDKPSRSVQPINNTKLRENRRKALPPCQLSLRTHITPREVTSGVKISKKAAGRKRQLYLYVTQPFFAKLLWRLNFLPCEKLCHQRPRPANSSQNQGKFG